MEKNNSFVGPARSPALALNKSPVASVFIDNPAFWWQLTLDPTKAGMAAAEAWMLGKYNKDNSKMFIKPEDCPKESKVICPSCPELTLKNWFINRFIKERS